MGSKPVRVHLTLNTDGVAAPALRAARMSTEILTLSLVALDAADLAAPPQLPGVFNFTFESREKPSVVKATYAAWLLARGFQELARGIRGTMEQAYIYVMTLKLSREIGTWGDLHSGLARLHKKANSLPFPALISGIEPELSSPLDFRREFTSLQRARNCLEHRDGVVARDDCDRGSDFLELRLPRLKFFLKEGGAEIELYVGQFIEKDTHLLIKRDIRVRQFPLGERIAFAPGEFHEIAVASWFFVNDLISRLPTVPRAEPLVAGEQQTT